MTSFCLWLALLPSLASTEHQHVCGFPPSLWCSHQSIAQQCGVVSQCTQYLSPQDPTPLVDFTLYYEALCPDCKTFNEEQLTPTFHSIGSIMNLTLVPYGNARETQHGESWVFECQHGPNECRANIIQTCAIHMYPVSSVHFPFITCMEQSKSAQPDTAAKYCAQELNLDIDKLMDCANSTLGNSLEHEMAVKTGTLDPPHQYVPWVTLNGIHTKKIEQEAEKDLLKLICDTYMGTKPEACNHRTKRLCPNT